MDDENWPVLQVLAFVTEKQVIPGCTWLIGGSDVIEITKKGLD